MQINSSSLQDVKGSQESLRQLHQKVNQYPASLFNLLLCLTACFAVALLFVIATVALQIHNRVIRFNQKPPSYTTPDIENDDDDDDVERENSSLNKLIRCPDDVVRLISFYFESQAVKDRNFINSLSSTLLFNACFMFDWWRYLFYLSFTCILHWFQLHVFLYRRLLATFLALRGFANLNGRDPMKL